MEEKKRMLTGDRPTGRLHIGHYFGSLKTRVEMQAFMKLKDKKNFVKNYINPMLESGLLEMTEPDKPKSSNQKYIAKK